MRWLFLSIATLSLCAQPFANEDLSLRRIVDFWEEGEYPMAKREMEAFLADFPESPHASTLSAALGDLMLREKSYEKALDYYAKIQDPVTADRVFFNRMQCLLQMHWHATLADECEAFLQKQPPNDSAQLLQTKYLLAVALYQQCLNQPANQETLATRALPYLEQLGQTEFAKEVAPAHAHVCCMLNRFEQAAQIYLNAASRGGEEGEKMTFQAALLQSKYDKTLALQTLEKISKEGSSYSQEAAYRWLTLQFELQQFDKITAVRKELLPSISTAYQPNAHWMIGQSLLALKNYGEAVEEFHLFLEGKPSEETLRPALLNLANASYLANNQTMLDRAIGSLKELNPQDPFLPEALLSKVQLLKTGENLIGAKETLQELSASFPLSPLGQLTFIEVEYGLKDWASCREKAALFLRENPQHELAVQAWPWRLASAAELSNKELFCADLEEMLATRKDWTAAEKLDWEFSLAQAYFERKQMDLAKEHLQKALQTETPFENRANGELLLALCYQGEDPVQSSFWGEKALADRATLFSRGEQHLSLFNAYLLQKGGDPQWETKAADHLFEAFSQKAPLTPENLLWLADFFYQKGGQEAKAEPLFAQYLADKNCDSSTEPFFLKLALLQQKGGSELETLEKMAQAYEQHRDTHWPSAPQVWLLLGQKRLASGKKGEAEQLFDRSAAFSPSKRNRSSAEAQLESAQLKIERNAKAEALTQLKSLVLQKRLANEPTHLEAALFYIDLVCAEETLPQKWAKQKTLLEKTKRDFESKEDLLSQDYHAARSQLPDAGRVYDFYIQFFEAEILWMQSALSQNGEEQKELQAKAKQTLLQLMSQPIPSPLRERIENCLERKFG